MEPEVVGEDYERNKKSDKLDALNEAIEGAVSDLTITVRKMRYQYYGEDEHPGYSRRIVLRKEAVERIKKFLE